MLSHHGLVLCEWGILCEHALGWTPQMHSSDTLIRSTPRSATPVRQPFYFVTSVGSRRNRAIH